MMGVFPTVTPPNWTTLATGNWPKTHGITCFQNHTLGKSLNISEYNWDSRRIESELTHLKHPLCCFSICSLTLFVGDSAIISVDDFII